jgi:hypothetical protein
MRFWSVIQVWKTIGLAPAQASVTNASTNSSASVGNECLYELKAAFGRGRLRAARFARRARRPTPKRAEPPGDGPGARPQMRRRATSTAGIEGGGCGEVRDRQRHRDRHGSTGLGVRQIRAWFGPRVAAQAVAAETEIVPGQTSRRGTARERATTRSVHAGCTLRRQPPGASLCTALGKCRRQGSNLRTSD